MSGYLNLEGKSYIVKAAWIGPIPRGHSNLQGESQNNKHTEYIPLPCSIPALELPTGRTSSRRNVESHSHDPRNQLGQKARGRMVEVDLESQIEES